MQSSMETTSFQASGEAAFQVSLLGGAVHDIKCSGDDSMMTVHPQIRKVLAVPGHVFLDLVDQDGCMISVKDTSASQFVAKSLQAVARPPWNKDAHFRIQENEYKLTTLDLRLDGTYTLASRYSETDYNSPRSYHTESVDAQGVWETSTTNEGIVLSGTKHVHKVDRQNGEANYEGYHEEKKTSIEFTHTYLISELQEYLCRPVVEVKLYFEGQPLGMSLTEDAIITDIKAGLIAKWNAENNELIAVGDRLIRVNREKCRDRAHLREVAFRDNLKGVGRDLNLSFEKGHDTSPSETQLHQNSEAV